MVAGVGLIRLWLTPSGLTVGQSVSLRSAAGNKFKRGDQVKPASLWGNPRWLKTAPPAWR